MTQYRARDSDDQGLYGSLAVEASEFWTSTETTIQEVSMSHMSIWNGCYLLGFVISGKNKCRFQRWSCKTKIMHVVRL